MQVCTDNPLILTTQKQEFDRKSILVPVPTFIETHSRHF